MRASRFLAVSLLLTLFATSAFAQGLATSSLTGRAAMDDGTPVPGVTVTVTSRALQGARTAVTGETGDYILHLLPPGDYTVTFELAGMGSVRRTITLSAARTERLDAKMQAAAAENITVTAAAPITATTESTQVSTNFKQELIEELPVNRNITAITLLAPGVNDNGPGANIMISGAMSFENLFLVNGVTINENLRGQPQNLFIEDAIQETTIMSGAVSAEYGRFTGGVVNALTKSGSNDLAGSYRLNLTNDSWAAETPLTVSQADVLNRTHEATLGGPILRDRLWFFLAGRRADSEFERQTNLGGTLSGDQDPRPFAYPYTSEETRIEGKGTLSFTPRHTVTGSYIDVDAIETNYSFDEIMDAASLVPDRQTPNSLLALHYGGVLGSNFYVEGQYSRRDFAFIGSGARTTDLIAGTLVLDRTRATRFNSPTFRREGPEERNNQSYLIKGSYFLPTRSFGTHDIKIGVEEFTEVRDVDNYQSGSDFRISIGRTIVRGDQIFMRVLGGSTATDTRIIWNPIEVRTQGSEYTTRSAFLNDTMNWGAKWRFTFGLRYDQNDAIDGRGAQIADDSAFSPRVAAHYDLRGDGRLIFNASFGQYVAKLAEGAANDADPAGRTSSYQWNYRGPSINNTVTAPTSSLIPTAEVIRRVFEWFNQQGGVNGLRPYRSVSIPGFDSRIQEGGLTSPNMKEWTLGMGSQLSSTSYVRVDFIHRDWDDFYSEIINSGTGKTPPSPSGEIFDLAIIGNSNSFDRKYDGVQLQFASRPWGRLRLGGNYTWSRLTGNLTGETDSDGPVTGSADAYPEYRREEWNYPMGYVAGDQRHRARAWIGYDFRTTRFGNFNVSLLQAYDSGQAVSLDVNIDPSDYITNPGYRTPPTSITYFFGGRGTLRTDNIYRTDLALNYRIRLARGIQLFVQPEVVNIFNHQNQDDFVDTVTILDEWNPFTTDPVEGVHWRKSENFGQATEESDFQTPRTFRVSLGLRF